MALLENYAYNEKQTMKNRCMATEQLDVETVRYDSWFVGDTGKEELPI